MPSSRLFVVTLGALFLGGPAREDESPVGASVGVVSTSVEA